MTNQRSVPSAGMYGAPTLSISLWMKRLNRRLWLGSCNRHACPTFISVLTGGPGDGGNRLSGIAAAGDASSGAPCFSATQHCPPHGAVIVSRDRRKSHSCRHSPASEADLWRRLVACMKNGWSWRTSRSTPQSVTSRRGGTSDIRLVTDVGGAHTGSDRGVGLLPVPRPEAGNRCCASRGGGMPRVYV